MDRGALFVSTNARRSAAGTFGPPTRTIKCPLRTGAFLSACGFSPDEFHPQQHTFLSSRSHARRERSSPSFFSGGCLLTVLSFVCFAAHRRCSIRTRWLASFARQLCLLDVMTLIRTPGFPGRRAPASGRLIYTLLLFVCHHHDINVSNRYYFLHPSDS